MTRHTTHPFTAIVGALVSLSAGSAAGDELLLAVIEFDGLPTGIRLLDPATGAIIRDFVPADFPNNGMLQSVECIAAGPNRTVLFGQPGGNGVITQYDEFGSFVGVYLGGTADPNPVDNIRSMVVSPDGRFLYTADWDDSNDIHRFDFATGAPAGIGGDPLGTFVFGSQAAPDLGQPQAIEFHADGDLLVGDLQSNRVVRYDADSGARIGEFSGLSFVASIQDIDQLADGTVVTTESGSGNRVRRFSATGSPLNAFGFTNPDGVHVLDDGSYLVGSGATFGQGKGLFRVAANGTILETIDSTRSYGAIELITLIDPVCLADFTGEGDLDIFDILAFLDAFNGGDPAADFTGEGDLDIFDILAFLDAFNTGCP